MWMGLALMVSTRLWVAGIVSPTRDSKFANRLMAQVRAHGQVLRAVLVCTDGWAAYPGSIRRAFREKVKETAGRGRPCLQVWPQLHIGTVIKHTVKKRVVEVTRRMVQGSAKRAAVLLRRSGGASYHLQFLLGTSGAGQTTSRTSLYTSHGGWTHRSCLESGGVPELPGGSCSLGRT